MVVRIIFLISAKFNERDYHRFGFQILKSKGFLVEVWETSALLFDSYNKNYQVPDPYNYQPTICFQSFNDLNLKLKSLTKNDLVIDINKVYLNDKIEPLSNAWVCSLIFNLNPNINFLPFIHKIGIDKKFGLTSNIYSSFKNELKGRLIKSWENLFLQEPLKTYNAVVLGGKIARKYLKSSFVKENALIIKAHTLDFDLFLSRPKDLITDFGEYCVFLDEAVTNHPDFLRDGIAGVDTICDSETYFKELNNFFDFIEDKFNLKVIIASHPRISYNDYNPFGNRRVVHGKTLQLVENASFVLAHSSTSLNFAVLLRKKILFIDSISYHSSLQMRVELKCFLLGSNKIVISDPIMEVMTLQLNEKKYREYINYYIKETRTSRKLFWEIFADRIATV